MNQKNLSPLPRCGLFRRLAAILYDTLLLLAVLFLAALLILPVSGEGGLRPGHPLITSYYFLITFLFFTWFWTHGGQTLGMRAWRIRIRSRTATPITLWQCLLRFLVAIVSWGALGMGFLWSLADKEKLTWHDRFSMTELVVIPKD
jgi:uncharacterized RDD family membrane protein YckC